MAIRKKTLAGNRVGCVREQRCDFCEELAFVGEVLNKYITNKKDMDDSGFREGFMVNLDTFNIKKEDMLVVMGCIRIDRSIDLDKIHPRCLWEARMKIAATAPCVNFCILVSHG